MPAIIAIADRRWPIADSPSGRQSESRKVGNATPCPSVTSLAIDASHVPRYSGDTPKSQETIVAVNSIQLGQVWRSDADGQDYLVTKVYNEVFTQYAMLRPAGITAPDAPTVRIKVAKSPQGATLPGYAFTQEGSF
jgi:hypothetical protein